MFVAATANRIDLLPAEIIRKGRFDQIFFVDLPSETERAEIFRVHLRNRGADLGQFDVTILSKGTKGWNGAEIGPTGQGPVVVSQTFNYRRQLHYPAEVEVGVACTEVRRRSFVLSYGVFRKGSDELIGDGRTVLAWLDYAANTSAEIPSKVRAYLTAP